MKKIETINYEHKYMKYKNKYINLKQNGGNNFFDFDIFFKDLTLNDFLSNRISKSCLNDIKSNLQLFYTDFYKKITGLDCEEIIIPIYAENDNLYKVNYNKQYKYIKDLYKEEIEKLSNNNINVIILQKLTELLKEINKINKIEYLFNKKITDFLNNLITNIDLTKVIYFIDFLKVYIEKFINTYYDNFKLDDFNEDNFEKFLQAAMKGFNIGNKYTFKINNFDYCNTIILEYNDLKKEENIFKNIDKFIDFYDSIKYFDFEITDEGESNQIKYNVFSKLNEINSNKTQKIIQLFSDMNKRKNILYLKTQEIDKLKTEINNIIGVIEDIMKSITSHIYINRFCLTNKIGLHIDDFIEYYDEKRKNKKQNDYINFINEQFVKSIYTDKIIQITLQYIKYDSVNDTYNIEYHSNAIILSKFKKSGENCILGQRIEPHRRSNTYCRNSVRKEIRNIFKRLPNFYYVDYYMKDRDGLQTFECIDIYSDYIHQECNLKILDGIEGFCSSWTAYICSIILLNKNKSTNDIAKYLTLFDIDEKSVLEYHKETLEKLKTEKDNNKIKLFYEYIKKFYGSIEYYFAKGYKYIISTNLKLYYFIMYFYKFIDPSIITLHSELFPEDKNKLSFFCDKIDINNFDEKIKENNKNITLSENILNIDKKHKCYDEIFEHEDFCKEEEVCKILNKDHECYKDDIKMCLNPITHKKKIYKEDVDIITQTQLFIKELEELYKQSKNINKVKL